MHIENIDRSLPIFRRERGDEKLQLAAASIARIARLGEAKQWARARDGTQPPTKTTTRTEEQGGDQQWRTIAPRAPALQITNLGPNVARWRYCSALTHGATLQSIAPPRWARHKSVRFGFFLQLGLFFAEVCPND